MLYREGNALHAAISRNWEGRWSWNFFNHYYFPESQGLNKNYYHKIEVASREQANVIKIGKTTNDRTMR